MSLFRKQKKSGQGGPAAATTSAQAPAPAAEAPDPPTDPLMGDAQARRFQAELAQGRWQEFHDFLEATRDWNERSFYVSRLCDVEGRPAWLDEWLAARAGSPMPLLMSGSHRVNWAWEARGSGRAHTVTKDAWEVFYARLVDADRELAQAAALDPADPTPYATSLPVARGLELGLTEQKRRFAEATHRVRWHVSAHIHMIQALAAKWGGSDEEMFGFAREASAEAPEGHSVHKVIALAHLEKWLGTPRQSADGKTLQGVYFQDEQVRGEIYRAADRSIRSPQYHNGRFAITDRNVFAMCFWLMKDYPAQLEQMALIGPYIQSVPWTYQGKAGRAYERARTTALKQIPYGMQASSRFTQP